MAARRGPDEIDALLFDFGGVVAGIDFNRAFVVWGELAGRDPAQIASRFSLDDAYRRHERGEIDAEEYFRSLRTSLGLDLDFAKMLEGWNAIFLDEIEGMPELLERARTRFPLYLFSNSNPTHEAYWRPRYHAILGNFERIFVSSTIGLRKPDRAAYDRVAREIGRAPDRILFFDDNLDNVGGAVAAGLKAIHVRSFEDVSRALEPLL